MAPKFEHDCDEGCRFLGHLAGVDHWVHAESDPAGCELIQRRSDQPADYSAWPLQDVPLLPAPARQRWALTLALLG
jgi:hypothetical protein